MWYIMLSAIPQWEQTHSKTFLYNNLTVNLIWVCYKDFMLFSHTLKPCLALVLSQKYRSTDNVMTVKNCRMLF